MVPTGYVECVQTVSKQKLREEQCTICQKKPVKQYSKTKNLFVSLITNYFTYTYYIYTAIQVGTRAHTLDCR